MSASEVLLASFTLLFLVSIDVLAMGFVYGGQDAKMSLPKLVIISGIGNALLAAALFLGHLIEGHVASQAATWTAFTLFTLTGLFKLVAWYNSRNKQEKPKYSPPWREVLLIALLLSIDGVGIGFASGLSNAPAIFICIIVALSFFVDIFLFRAGEHLARTTSPHNFRALGWLGGALLILMGILGLLI